MSNEPVTIGAAELGEVINALAEYSRVDAGLAELHDKYDAVVYDVTTTAGMKAACEARRTIREPRYRVEEIRKAAKAPLLALGRQVDNEAKRITAALLELETPIDKQIGTEELRRENEKKAREEAERTRVGEIQRRLGKIRALPEAYTSAVDPQRLAEVIGQLEGGLTFDYQEFAAEAETARQAALVALRQAHIEAMERLERAAAEQAERDAQAAREAAERAAVQERERQERERAEAERLERERLERERQDAERRAAEEARLAEVRRKLDAEQVEQKRLAGIRQWIAALNGPTHLTATDSPALIEQAVNTLLGAVIDERYGEFHTEAGEAREAGIQRLCTLLDAARAHKAEQERITRERAELERREREQAERQAEIDRQQREAREAEERRQAAERADEERKATQAAAERARQEKRARALADPPDALAIAKTVAEAYLVDDDIAAQWIANVAHEDWVTIATSIEQEVAA